MNLTVNSDIYEKHFFFYNQWAFFIFIPIIMAKIPKGKVSKPLIRVAVFKNLLPIVHVMFGVNMDLSGEPHTIIYKTEKPIKVGNREFDWINIMSHCFDKSTAPAGKSAIEVWYGADYDYWKELSRDKEQYKSEKNRIAEETAKALDVRWPGFKDAIEMIDVPTPVTYERYTGNWRGSPDGWYLTESNFKDQGMKMKVRGLKNLYTVSQWCAPYTGTVSTSLGGRQLIQILCRKNGVEFKTG